MSLLIRIQCDYTSCQNVGNGLPYGTYSDKFDVPIAWCKSVHQGVAKYLCPSHVMELERKKKELYKTYQAQLALVEKEAFS